MQSAFEHELHWYNVIKVCVGRVSPAGGEPFTVIICPYRHLSMGELVGLGLAMFLEVFFMSMYNISL
jgi:hypothetical protein